ncbi:carboxypeptidase regulatory-like domain-containing protein [bacterium]|nr:carboxypeptidase regulatory-like domain-containing protein [bacterium]
MKTRTNMNFARSVSLLLLTPLMTIGCGSADEMNRQSVSGTVSLAGDPVITGLIEFCPVGSEGVSSGASIADGEYSIPSAKGLPPGDYLIRISSAGEEAVASTEMPGEAKLQKELIPASYNVNSQEIRSVSAGEKNIFDFEIP